MSRPKNILFIMYDQLRFDYLSCAGHKSLQTPNMDRVASEGLRFTRCYVQSPICGASRMSFYTGRYVSSHGSAWNNFPLKVGEQTLGDHLRKAGMGCWLVGKTHMKADNEGLERLGIAHDGIIGARLSECGFDVFVRDDGLWGTGPEGHYDEKRSPYNEYLKGKGYAGENPWADFANAGVTADGRIASGWLMEHADKPANIREEDSETPWLTSRAIDFLTSRDIREPWLCHVSYIKPHWPYIVPAPYHDMFGTEDIQPVQRNDRERINDPHPVYAEHMENVIGKAFRRDEVREKVIPAYMGLVKQCDDQLGRLLDFLDESGNRENTVIAITSDHGDYLGDHWLGEKCLFHEPSVKVPLIICDPSKEADASRGGTCDELVECIDLVPTFLEMAGGEVPGHILEGRSLLPFLHGRKPGKWREFVVSEYDYSPTPMAVNLNMSPRDARLFMVADKRWKMMHAEGGFRPMLFDMENDPFEYLDLGNDANSEEVIDGLYEKLNSWALRMSQRTTVSDQQIISNRGKSRKKGIVVGAYAESEVDAELMVNYLGPAKGDYRNS